MTVRKYLTAKFRPEDRRTYTYHWDGEEELRTGDRVKVAGRRDEGWSVVTVQDPDVLRPEFDTKPVLGLAPPEPGKLL